MSRDIDLYKYEATTDSLLKGLSALRADFDAHNHGGSITKRIQTLHVDTLVARTSVIATTSLQVKKVSYSDATAGFWVGVDTDKIAKLYVGDGSQFMKWTGSALQISGQITATSGTIGGWVIGATTLTGGTVVLDSGGIITGGTIQTSASGKRVVMDSDVLQVYDSGGVLRLELDGDSIGFQNSSGTPVGVITATSADVVSFGSLLTNGTTIMAGAGTGSASLAIDATNYFFASGNLGYNVSAKDIIPSANATHDLGSSGSRWAEIHVNTLVLSGSTISSIATAALDNLASVAINTSLISDTASTDDLGSSGVPWNNLYTDDIYLTNNAGTIKYNGNTAFSFFASRIEIASTYTEIRPSASLGCNLGSASFRWNDIHVAGGDFYGNLDMNSNDIDNLDELFFIENTVNPSTAGQMHYFNSGGSQEFQCNAGGFEGSIDLTAT